MRGGWLFFNDKDNVVIDEIMKIHNINKDNKEIVAKHYENMLKEIKESVKD